MLAMHGVARTRRRGARDGARLQYSRDYNSGRIGVVRRASRIGARESGATRVKRARNRGNSARRVTGDEAGRAPRPTQRRQRMPEALYLLSD